MQNLDLLNKISKCSHSPDNIKNLEHSQVKELMLKLNSYLITAGQPPKEMCDCEFFTTTDDEVLFFNFL